MTLDTTNTIIKIKVKVSQVKTFPFDVVYIISVMQKALLPRLFPYSLVLPFNTDLIERLRAVRVHIDGTITMTQHGAATLPRSWSQGQLIEQFLDMDQVKKSFLVIPVLPRTHMLTRNKKCKDRNPAYLIANQHREGEHEDKKGKKKTITMTKDIENFRAFFNEFAVMFTPRGSIRPICRACPRHLESVQGKCSLGEQKCYHTLIIQPERRYDDEQLQTNGADGHLDTD